VNRYRYRRRVHAPLYVNGRQQTMGHASLSGPSGAGSAAALTTRAMI
jgi:hypothetical protein